MGTMKFVLTDELEQKIRDVFRKKGDNSKLAELFLREGLGMSIPEYLEEHRSNLRI